MQVNLKFHVNGTPVELTIEPHLTLLEVLRDQLALTGTKEGCGTGDCGACTVLVDGKPINSCLLLAVEADGQEITTVEGLVANGNLHPLQQAFIEQGGLQCGYCTPGMLMSAYALLKHNPNPDPEAIRESLAGNLCRCTGYDKIIRAVLSVAKVV